MSQFTLKVKTETLMQISTDLLNKVQKAQNQFQQIEDVVKATSKYWEGEGHSAMAAAYGYRSDDFIRTFSQIREHALKLNQMAGIYVEAEKNAAEMTQILPDDVILPSNFLD